MGGGDSSPAGVRDGLALGGDTWLAGKKSPPTEGRVRDFRLGSGSQDRQAESQQGSSVREVRRGHGSGAVASEGDGRGRRADYPDKHDADGQTPETIGLHGTFAEKGGRAGSSTDCTSGELGSKIGGSTGQARRSSGDPAIHGEVLRTYRDQLDGDTPSPRPVGQSTISMVRDRDWFTEDHLPPFSGHTILRRAQVSRVASSEEEHSIPLQAVNVSALDFGSLRARMNRQTLQRLDSLMELLHTPGGDGGATVPGKRLHAGDAQKLCEAGILVPASELPTKGWIQPFSVIEEKATGLRRRFIAWPKDKNLSDGYGADVPLEHISKYMDPVLAPCASLLDLKASFYQVPVPETARHLFRCMMEDGTVYEFARIPMGYRASPEIMQLLTSVIAGVPSVVQEQFRAPPSVKVEVWIDNIRITGSREDVQTWTESVISNAGEGGVTLGEVERLVTQYTFIGVHFNHDNHTVKLGEKTQRRLREAVSFQDMTVRELEAFGSRAVYAASVLGITLFRFYFFFKFVRRVLSMLNHGYITLQDRLEWSKGKLFWATQLRDTLVANTPRVIVAYSPEPRVTLVSDASFQGWGAILFVENGPVYIAGSRWESTPNEINSMEARALLLGILSFLHHLPKHIRILIDNTSVLGAIRKGVSTSGALSYELQEVADVLNKRSIQAEYRYIKSENNPADAPSRLIAPSPITLAKGYNMRRGDCDPWKFGKFKG
ncbi:TcC31.12 [Angomonas deanei]|nr:TcC31.12 [Angomonas deanei]|eukprot:EPY37483.1 TcC31.12 [Angomonas deanei]